MVGGARLSVVENVCLWCGGSGKMKIIKVSERENEKHNKERKRWG